MGPTQDCCLLIVLEKKLEPGTVPTELLDKDHQTWSDAGLFARWCARNHIAPVPAGTTWAERFQAGRDGWAINAGIVKDQTGNADTVHLAKLGVPYSATRDRMQAAGMLADSFPI
jgi:hypothetical protein